MVCICKDFMWVIYFFEEICNELDNCIGIFKLDIILAFLKFLVFLWKKIKLGIFYVYLVLVI